MGAKITILFFLVFWGALATLILMRFINGPLESIYLQDIMIFILPTWITALLIWGNPIKSLHLNKAPRLIELGGVAFLLLAVMPILNRLIEWNAGLHLPDALSGVEQWMAQQEANAAVATQNLLNVSNIGGLIALVLGVGVLTGMGEEFIFRGALQQIFQDRTRRVHVAIWLSAFIFSVVHIQFFGFFPRMLLGAFFGYLLVWSGNLWIPIFAHALNNSAVICISYFNKGHWLQSMGTTQSDLDWMAWVSLGALIPLLWIFKNKIVKKRD